MVLALYSRACRDDYCTARTLIIAPPDTLTPYLTIAYFNQRNYVQRCYFDANSCVEPGVKELSIKEKTKL